MLTASGVKDILSRCLFGSRAYLPLRSLYQGVFNRGYVRSRRNFLRQFVRPGDLVFDIGANIGDYTEAFLNLGARVVAVEPNPVCCQMIRSWGRKKRLAVRCEAIGDRQGRCVLHIEDRSVLSTISEEWMRRALQIHPGEYRWGSAVTTNLNTLDAIQREYGTPQFIKIDVQGAELRVLRGMSFQPPALSFEFHAFTSDFTRDCIQLPMFDSSYRFNIALEGTWEFVWPEWREKDAVLHYVSGLPTDCFGYIYARFKD